MTPKLPRKADLIDTRTRERMSGMAARLTPERVAHLWEAEGFSPPPERRFSLEDNPGIRRYGDYVAAAEWGSEGDVRRALRVFWSMSQVLGEHHDESAMEALHRQGYTFDLHGNPSGGPYLVGMRADIVMSARSTEVISDHIGRIESAASRDDPALVIGSAKELVESVAKIVLAKRDPNSNPDNNWTFPFLVDSASRALGVYKSKDPNKSRHQREIDRLLGALSDAVKALSDLRNAGGTGHGRLDMTVRLQVRDAHLAATAAKAWCDFILATLEESERDGGSDVGSSVEGGELF